MDFILWLIAVVLVISGIVAIVRSQLLWGIVIIVVGLLVGPGGVSIFSIGIAPAASGSRRPEDAGLLSRASVSRRSGGC